MASIRNTAREFFDACETGKGWTGCQQYCHPAATFSAQAGALTGVNTVQAYTETITESLAGMPGTKRAASLPGAARGITVPTL